MIQVLIADDEELVRAGVRLILESAEDIQVVGEAADGRSAVRMCRENPPHVALLDVRMPHVDGLSAAAELARVAPGTQVLVLTTFGEDRYVEQAVRAGAAGFLLKDIAPRELVAAVRAAAAGDPVLAPQILRRLFDRHLASDRTRRAVERLAELTETERAVLREVGTGASNAEIGARLLMSAGTVKAHLGRILLKSGCSNRVQAAVLAHEAGLVGPS